MSAVVETLLYVAAPSKDFPEGETASVDSRLHALVEHSDECDPNEVFAALGELGHIAYPSILRKLEAEEFHDGNLTDPNALRAVRCALKDLVSRNSQSHELLIQAFTDPTFKSWKELGMAIGKEFPKLIQSLTGSSDALSRGRSRAVKKFLREAEPEHGHDYMVHTLIKGDKGNPGKIDRIADLYYDTPTVGHPAAIADTKGLFGPDDIKPCAQLLKNHPLKSYCQLETLSSGDLEELFNHPLISINIVSADSGTFPAAFPINLDKTSPEKLSEHVESLHEGSYETHSWWRDDGVTASALLSAGSPWAAGKALRSKFHFYSNDEQRGNIIWFHLNPDEAPEAYENGKAIPIKAKIGKGGSLEKLGHAWDHRQGDALGTIVALGYELLNLGWFRGETYPGGVDIHNFDPLYVNSNSAHEHVLRALTKSMYYYQAPFRSNTGPWEDKPEKERATCVGAALWTARSTLAFHRRHGFHTLGVASDSYGDQPDHEGRSYEQQLMWLYDQSKQIIDRRIPDTEGAFARESDGRPLDSAIILLLSLYRLPLTPYQENAILRTWFMNMGEVAVRRWEIDEDAEARGERGDDLYMAKNYHALSNNKPPYDYFADRDVEGIASPEWPAILCWGGVAIARRILNTMKTNPEIAEKDYKILCRIIQKALVTILPETSEIHIQNTGETFTREKGKISEVFFRSTYAADGKTETEEHWEANHYCGLTMAHAPFAQMLILAKRIREMLDEIHDSSKPAK